MERERIEKERERSRVEAEEEGRDGLAIALEPRGVGADRLEALLDGAVGSGSGVGGEEVLDLVGDRVRGEATSDVPDDASKEELALSELALEGGKVVLEELPSDLAALSRTGRNSLDSKSDVLRANVVDGVLESLDLEVSVGGEAEGTKGSEPLLVHVGRLEDVLDSLPLGFSSTQHDHAVHCEPLVHCDLLGPTEVLGKPLLSFSDDLLILVQTKLFIPSSKQGHHC